VDVRARHEPHDVKAALVRSPEHGSADLARKAALRVARQLCADGARNVQRGRWTAQPINPGISR
jgi:hypothetical protein